MLDFKYKTDSTPVKKKKVHKDKDAAKKGKHFFTPNVQ